MPVLAVPGGEKLGVEGGAVKDKVPSDFLQRINEAVMVLEKQAPCPYYFAILSPKVVGLLKRDTYFVPLSDYINDVQPCAGEVGMYDMGHMQIRIIQAKGARRDENA